MRRKIKVASHVLMPKHEKLSEKAKNDLLNTYNITETELPEILITDPAIINMKPSVGDVIRITRNSPTAGTTYFYRCVKENKGVKYE